jgi:hypothetical protein
MSLANRCLGALLLVALITMMSAGTHAEELSTSPGAKPPGTLYDVSLLQQAGVTTAEIAELEPVIFEWLIADLATGDLLPERAKRFVASIHTAPYYLDRGMDHFEVAPPPPSGHAPPSASQPSATSRTCTQAWHGPGSGAWYRVDTACASSPWPSTSLEIGFGEVVYGPGREGAGGDGVYQGLGVFNTVTGVGGDFGFVHFKDRLDGRYKWIIYGNDETTGWRVGDLIIDPAVHPWIDLKVDIPQNGQMRMTVRDHASGTTLGQQVMSGWNPRLGLNPAGTHIGWYRFDSIAQRPELLTSGSELRHAQTRNWKLYENGWYRATPEWIAGGVRGYLPGQCCSMAEKAKVTPSAEVPWYASSVSIIYR